MQICRKWIAGLCVFIASTFAFSASSASADTYPDRAVKFVVPFAPGGSTDILARMLAKELASELGVSVVVENRAGAGSIVGTQAVARSQPDGYTILMTGMPFSTLPAVATELSFDPKADFTPIIKLGSLPTILVIPSSVKAGTLQDYIALLKQSTDPLNYSSAGIGSLNHLAGELFARLTGLDLTHVPYQSGGQATMALLSGEVNLLFTTTPPTISHLQAGTLRAIAISNDARVKALPDVPTFAEGGLPNFKSEYWLGLLAPAGTPETIVDTLNKTVNKILDSETMKKHFAELGLEPGGGSPDQFAKLIDDDIQRWLQIMKDTKSQ
ncbi:MAG: tripartite tricarboxylate transporter substrate binding protein [Candidimonas sp.]|jgi:tripartite-type tricarboxylate transporter receptor subunit TctC